MSLDFQDKRTEWFISVPVHCKDLSAVSGDQQSHFGHVHSYYEPATSSISFLHVYFSPHQVLWGGFFFCLFWVFFVFPLCYKPAH